MQNGHQPANPNPIYHSNPFATCTNFSSFFKFFPHPLGQKAVTECFQKWMLDFTSKKDEDDNVSQSFNTARVGACVNAMYINEVGELVPIGVKSKTSLNQRASAIIWLCDLMRKPPRPMLTRRNSLPKASKDTSAFRVTVLIQTTSMR